MSVIDSPFPAPLAVFVESLSKEARAKFLGSPYAKAALARQAANVETTRAAQAENEKRAAAAKAASDATIAERNAVVAKFWPPQREPLDEYERYLSKGQTIAAQRFYEINRTVIDVAIATRAAKTDAAEANARVIADRNAEVAKFFPSTPPEAA